MTLNCLALMRGLDSLPADLKAIFIDTGKVGDEAIRELDEAQPLQNSRHYRVDARSLAVLVAGGVGFPRAGRKG